MEPRNAVLCGHSLLVYTDVTFMMDNEFVSVSLYMGTPAVRSSRALSRAAVGPAYVRGHLGRGGTVQGCSRTCLRGATSVVVALALTVPR